MDRTTIRDFLSKNPQIVNDFYGKECPNWASIISWLLEPVGYFIVVSFFVTTKFYPNGILPFVHMGAIIIFCVFIVSVNNRITPVIKRLDAWFGIIKRYHNVIPKDYGELRARSVSLYRDLPSMVDKKNIEFNKVIRSDLYELEQHLQRFNINYAD